jgi:hypothetical protein
MNEVDRLLERVQSFWIVCCFILSFHFTFNLLSDYQLGPHPEIDRFFFGSVLGLLLGGWLAVAGFPGISFFVWTFRKLTTKG